MPEVRDLETKLVALRREVAEAKRSGLTPSQIQKLRAECWQLWAAIERYKYEYALDLAATQQ
jgi:hypothetical protein